MTTETTTCSVHLERDAIDRCARCGRSVCLTCAIPFRGEVLCIEDATTELGEPAAAPAPAAPTPLPRMAAAASVVAVLGTVFPWHQFGILTSILSAWSTESGVWPLLSAGSATGAGIAAILASRRGRGLRRAALRWAVGLSSVTAAAALLATLTAPAYVTHSPAPYLVLAASLTAGGVGSLALRRARR